MLPPDEVERRLALIERQTRGTDGPAGPPEPELLARGRAQVRAFLTEPSFRDGATLLRQICRPAPVRGATLTEHGLFTLGANAVWDTLTELAAAPAGDET